MILTSKSKKSGTWKILTSNSRKNLNWNDTNVKVRKMKIDSILTSKSKKSETWNDLNSNSKERTFWTSSNVKVHKIGRWRRLYSILFSLFPEQIIAKQKKVKMSKSLKIGPKKPRAFFFCKMFALLCLAKRFVRLTKATARRNAQCLFYPSFARPRRDSWSDCRLCPWLMIPWALWFGALRCLVRHATSAP